MKRARIFQGMVLVFFLALVLVPTNNLWANTWTTTVTAVDPGDATRVLQVEVISGVEEITTASEVLFCWTWQFHNIGTVGVRQVGLLGMMDLRLANGDLPEFGPDLGGGIFPVTSDVLPVTPLTDSGTFVGPDVPIDVIKDTLGDTDPTAFGFFDATILFEDASNQPTLTPGAFSYLIRTYSTFGLDLDGLPSEIFGEYQDTNIVAFNDIPGPSDVSGITEFLLADNGFNVPEPATLLLVGSGLLGFGVFRKRIRK